VLGTGDDQALFQWISDETASFAAILAGVVSVHIHAERTSGNKSIRLYAEIYEYTAAAAEILIATTALCDFLTDDESCIEEHAPLADDYPIAPTSKLLIKFLANVGAVGANVTLNLYAEGETTSSVSLPTPTSPLIEAEIAAHAALPNAHHSPPAAIKAFYSEANDLSDVINTTVSNQTIPALSYHTFLNIASGGCRFLGGTFITGGSAVTVRVNVDGGAEQTINPFTVGNEWVLVVPPIQCDDTLLIRGYNNHSSVVLKYAGMSWHRAL
jgi:hypothetical protein